MFTEARKLSLIEAIIKSSDDALLNAMEVMVSKDETDGHEHTTSVRFNDLLGELTPEEAEAMKQAIYESFEKINPDDWK